jgi:hypothetical protein
MDLKAGDAVRIKISGSTFDGQVGMINDAPLVIGKRTIVGVMLEVEPDVKEELGFYDFEVEKIT